jgi:hypothetical protein
MKVLSEFDMIDAYESSRSKRLGSSHPNLLSKGNRLYWDITVTDQGSYDVYVNLKDKKELEYKIVCGIHKRDGVDAYARTVKQSSASFQPDSNSLYVGTLELYPNDKYLYIQTCNHDIIPINGCSIWGPSEVKVDRITSNKQLRDRRHCSACYFRSLYDDKFNYYYREYEFKKLPSQTYATLAFVNGYIGLVPGKQFNFSIWHGNGRKCKVVKANPMTYQKEFTHEGNGIHTHFKHNIVADKRYALMLKLEHGQEEQGLKYTDYTAFFNVFDEYNEPSQWVYIATIRKYGQHYHTGGIRIKGKYYSSIGGFLEQPGKANGHLYERSVLVGNDMASLDGENWHQSSSMVYHNKVEDNSTCIPYPSDRRMLVGIGGYPEEVNSIKSGYIMDMNLSGPDFELPEETEDKQVHVLKELVDDDDSFDDRSLSPPVDDEITVVPAPVKIKIYKM